MDTTQNPTLTPGEAEMRRAKESEDSLDSGSPQAVQISDPASREHPVHADWETLVGTGGAKSRAGDLAAALFSSLCQTVLI